MQKSLICLDFFNFKPLNIAEKYIAPIHLGEYSIISLFVATVIYNFAFSEDPQSIFHIVPPFVVETTCALQVFPLFLRLVCPTLDFDMGFL